MIIATIKHYLSRMSTSDLLYIRRYIELLTLKRVEENNDE